MAISKLRKKQGKYRACLLDENDNAHKRLLAGKHLIELAGGTRREVANVRRVCEALMRDPNMPDDLRDEAYKLLRFVAVAEGEHLSKIKQQHVEPEELVEDEVSRELGEEVEDLEPLPMGLKLQEATKPVPKIPESHQDKLLRRNAHWNAQPVPQKWLYFYKPSDLASFGIADPVNDPRRLFVDICDENKDGSPFGKPNPLFPNRMCNPLYIDAYRAWKQKRFPHGLPERNSTWRIRLESRSYVDACPELLRMWPAEFPCGEELRSREHLNGDVAGWEEPFCHELYFEILLTSPRFDPNNPRQQQKEFIVMFEIDTTDNAYFANREKQLTVPVKPSVTELNIPKTKMVCSLCANASRDFPAPVHDCSQHMTPEIFARIGAPRAQ